MNTTAGKTMSKLLRFPYMPQQFAVTRLKTFIKAFVGGVGSGKTFFLVLRAIEACWVHRFMGVEAAIVSPNLPQARMSVIPTMVKALNMLGLKENVNWSYHKSYHYFIIFGTKLHIQSGHSPKHLQGSTLVWVGIDEPFIQDRFVYDIMLQRIRDERSLMREMVLTGTPEQMNWGYEILVENQNEHAAWVQSSSEANPHLPKELLDVLKANYDDQMIAAYLSGEFVILNKTAAFYSFGNENIKPSLKYNPHLPLVLTCDFNKAPMCWNIIQEEKVVENHSGMRLTKFNVLDEIHIKGTNTHECLDEFVRRWNRKNGTFHKHKGQLIVSGDYSGHSPIDTVATLSNFETIMKRLEYEWGYDNVELEIMPNPKVVTRVNETNGRLKNSFQERFVFFDNKRCRKTITHFRKASYKPNTQVIDKAFFDPHHCDAIGYRIHYVHLDEAA